MFFCCQKCFPYGFKKLKNDHHSLSEEEEIECCDNDDGTPLLLLQIFTGYEATNGYKDLQPILNKLE